MNIKALVMDLDGTLYSSSKEIAARNAALKRLKLYLKKKGMNNMIKGKHAEMLKKLILSGRVSYTIRYLHNVYGIPSRPFEIYVNDLNPSTFGIRNDNKMIKLLYELRNSYKLFIFTNSPNIWSSRAIKAIGISKFFNTKNTINREVLDGYLKPEKNSYAIMLKRIGFNPNEVIFLDDKPENVNGAKKAGVKSILIHNGKGFGISIYAALRRIKTDAEGALE